MSVLARGLCITFAAAVAFSACGDGDEAPSGTTITVVATTTHVADFVRNVGGDRVAVRQILRPESDPHDYEPRPSDARSVADAEIVFRSGGDLDQWLDDLIESAGGEAQVVALGESVRGERDDPHWWQDPRNVETAVVAVRDALARADPGGEEAYRRNAAAYTARLRRLDRSIAACMREVPAARRKLVTTHDAFGYFVARYDIELIGALIPSQSTEAQASAGETARLIGQVEREGVEAIFPERALDPELERAVARETEAAVGDALWGDALGVEGSGGETYLKATASNAAALMEGFTGGRSSCPLQE